MNLNFRGKLVFKMKTRIWWSLACPQLNLSILRIDINNFLLLLVIIVNLISMYNFIILLSSFNLFFFRRYFHSLIVKFCSLSVLDVFFIHLETNGCFWSLWNLILKLFLRLRFLFTFTVFIFSILILVFLRLTFLDLLFLIRQL